MAQTLGPVAALLLGVFFLVTGSGLQNTLLPLRGAFEGFSAVNLGILGSSYYLGFVFGCLLVPHIVRRSGHIRAFTALTAGAVATMLAHPLFVEPHVWFALRGTTWGFRLATVGGNPEAARRAGFPVTTLLLSAMLAGGALAGLGGMIHFAGTEYQLRPGLLATMGYTAFLASWLAKHKPIPVLFSSMLFAALIVAGDSLQIDSGLPAASINILTGLILIAVLGWTGVKSKKGA